MKDFNELVADKMNHLKVGDMCECGNAKITKELLHSFSELQDEFICPVCQTSLLINKEKTKFVYLKDDKDNYYFEGDYCYLVGPVPKEEAQPMTQITAFNIIKYNKHLTMEEV